MVHFIKYMTPMLIQIPRWLWLPEVWRFVGFASTVVGLLCYALSSSFNHLFGEWNLLKIFLYSVFSFIICLMILFAKVWQHSTSLLFKAHLAVLVLTITSVYTFFYDKAVKGKPDAFSLISCAAFSVMSLSLSKQSHFGFEVDLLYFFLGCLIIQLMKIKLLLAFVGVGIGYSLIILRSSLDNPPENRYLGLQDHLVIQVDSQQSNTGSAVFMPQLMACIEALQQNNSNLVNMLLKQVKGHLETIDDSKDNDQIPEVQLVTDHDFVIDALPSRTINDLHEIAKRMVASGFEKVCSHVYSSSRREFLEESLSRLGLFNYKLSNEDVHRLPWQNLEDEIERWIKACNVALRILFPSERQLCERVFLGFSSVADLSFVEVCRGSMIQLLRIVDVIATGSPSPECLFKIHRMFETLRDLIPELESLFPIQYSVSLRNEAIMIQNRLGEAIGGILVELGDRIFSYPALAAIPDGGLDPITRFVMNSLRDACWSQQTLEQVFKEYPKFGDRKRMSSSLSVKMAWIIEQLECHLEASSKIYEDPALGYMMNNGRYIEQKAKDSELGTLLGDHWMRKHIAKVQQNLENYQRSSWNKVLDFLKLDSNESMGPDVATESMKEKLNLFNLHIEEICSVQCTWFVFDEQLREEIRISIENILLPAYEKFIMKFQNILGKLAYEYIEYGMFDIQARLKDLFNGIRSRSFHHVRGSPSNIPWTPINP